jgi:hypothetical protein
MAPKPTPRDIQVWFVLPDGTNVACNVMAIPRRGDTVRFAHDGQAYEVAEVEHIATPQGTSHGIRYTKVLMRLVRPVA